MSHSTQTQARSASGRDMLTEDPAQWIVELSKTISAKAASCRHHLKTQVLLCVVDNRQSLVVEPTLREDSPTLLNYLKRLAIENELLLLDDRRADETGIEKDRRAQWAPILALGASVLEHTSNVALAGHLDDHLMSSTSNQKHITHTTTQAARLLLSSSPSRSPVRANGDTNAETSLSKVAATVVLAAATRTHGSPTRVAHGSTVVAGVEEPKLITRYDYTFPLDDGNRSFSYFESQNFHALGYDRGEDSLEVVIDVFMGGGPASGPQIWGEFEHVANDSLDVHLFGGDSDNDDYGLINASYSIGVSPTG